MKVLKNIAKLYAVTAESPERVIEDAALVFDTEKIRWVGPEADLPTPYANLDALDAEGKLLIPGLIDCHTHLAFAGWREDEFVKRALGISYLDIAKTGGGILATVQKTRAASKSELIARARIFAREMLKLGVTTIECKSGYGLTFQDEIKLLEVYSELEVSQRLVPTFLGAHTIPPEYRDNRAGYIQLLTERLIPEVARRKLAVFVDIFVEEGAFTHSEASQILTCAKSFGLLPKLHVDQLSNGAGAKLAADLGAVSADHLEFSDLEGRLALATAGVVAVFLPFASMYLGKQAPKARDFIEAGVEVALATDFNPGSAPSYHLPLAMTLGVTLSGLTPMQALKAVTLNAAKALRLESKIGSLEPGKVADFALIDAISVEEWLYHFAPNRCVGTFVSGSLQVQAGPGVC